ncbi:MAG: cyclase family protein [Pseudohongiellaceae bacterium]
MIKHILSLGCTICYAVCANSAFAIDPNDYHFIDLTHSYNSETLYWPTSTSKFELEVLEYGETDGGYFYSANNYSSPEHGGTHLDAPIHFHANGMATDELPLEQLIAPAIVINVRDKAAADRNYRLSVEDVLAFEEAHGRIEPGTAVLLRTGWARFWPDAEAYLGDDTPGDASNLSFPSYGEEAVRLLVEERRVVMLGVDTASIDYGRSTDFMVHRIASARNVVGLENLRALNELPPTGFTVVALPMKIAGGSGGPVRVVAMVPR